MRGGLTDVTMKVVAMDHSAQHECLSCLLVDLATGVSVRVSLETRNHLLDAIIRFLVLNMEHDPDADMTLVRDLEKRGKTARTDEEWDVIVEHTTKAFRCSLPVGRPTARRPRVYHQSV